MGTVVGGFVLPHVPLMFTAPTAPAEAVRQRIRDAYAQVARRLAALRATSVVVIGTDHYINLGPRCLPQYLIAVGDVDGPAERLPGLDRMPLPDDRALARHIAAHGHLSGLDWAVAKTFTADHSVAIPHRLAVAPAGLPVVPVVLACGVEPLLPPARAAAVGEGIRAAVEAWDDDARVAVIGSGGISHWVGTAEMGRINSAFDERVLALVTDGDVPGLCAFDNAEVAREAGNGAWEIRTFIAALAAVGPCRGEVIAYEAVPAWITGMGFAEVTPLSEPAARAGAA
ncbi:protocatechuate 3,4-dioxygenase [Streptomyces albus subsp. albus]|nr:protocatechuate 3,4-dioxygenase [Streptomyces albus subsp. albus]